MKMKIVMTILAVLLIAAGGAGTYYYYTKYQAAQSSLENPELLAKTEVKTLTDKLGKLIKLPSDEDPNVATVLDQEKLKDQPFFVNAKNGDKIVIYSQKKVAILYRESENIIIEVAPLTMESPDPQASEAPTKSKVEATPAPAEQ